MAWGLKADLVETCIPNGATSLHWSLSPSLQVQVVYAQPSPYCGLSQHQFYKSLERFGNLPEGSGGSPGVAPEVSAPSPFPSLPSFSEPS